MTVPIRSMPEAVEAVRTAQIERGISYESIEEIAGMASGSVAKYLSWAPSRNFGVMSLFEIPAALGKAWALVDDPEQIAKVKGRWAKRKGSGGASIQIRKRKALASSLASVAGIDQELAKLELSNRMRELRGKVKPESLKNSGKRRMMMMGKRARQQHQAHAARARWAKEQEAARLKDGKGKDRKARRDADAR